MLHEKYYVELKKYQDLLRKKNCREDAYNGTIDRWKDPVLTAEHIPLTWRFDLNPETNPFFMERLGVNAVMNSGAIELDNKFYLVARVEGNDRKSFFAVAESENGVDGRKRREHASHFFLSDSGRPLPVNLADGLVSGIFLEGFLNALVQTLVETVAGHAADCRRARPSRGRARPP